MRPVAKAWTWNYAREVQHDSWHGRGSMTFLNYWEVSAGGLVWRRALDDRLTRGGPSTLSPAGSSWNINGGTDGRRWLSLRANINRSGSDAGDSSNGATRPGSTASPSLSAMRNNSVAVANELVENRRRTERIRAAPVAAGSMR